MYLNSERKKLTKANRTPTNEFLYAIPSSDSEVIGNFQEFNLRKQGIGHEGEASLM